MIRIRIVDDNKRNRLSLTDQLRFDNTLKIVLEPNDGGDYLEQMKHLALEQQPEVVLMDIEMPILNGIETVAHSTILYPAVKYLMLTVFDDDNKIFDAIQAGANGYLLKDEKTSTIIQHITELILHNSVPMSPGIARKTLALLSHSVLLTPLSTKEATETHESILSKREVEVLTAMAEGRDYRQIAAALYLSANTIKKHIANIYTKLHVSSKAQAINLAREKKMDIVLLQKTIKEKEEIIFFLSRWE